LKGIIVRKEKDLSKKKVLRTFYLDKKLSERLSSLSATTRVPQAVYLREGLDLILNKYERKSGKKKGGS
jgi:predicted DNA-binding protein